MSASQRGSDQEVYLCRNKIRLIYFHSDVGQRVSGTGQRSSGESAAFAGCSAEREFNSVEMEQQ